MPRWPAALAVLVLAAATLPGPLPAQDKQAPLHLRTVPMRHYRFSTVDKDAQMWSALYVASNGKIYVGPLHARRCRQRLRVRSRRGRCATSPTSTVLSASAARASGPTARSTSRCRNSTATSTSARSARTTVRRRSTPPVTRARAGTASKWRPGRWSSWAASTASGACWARPWTRSAGYLRPGRKRPPLPVPHRPGLDRGPGPRRRLGHLPHHLRRRCGQRLRQLPAGRIWKYDAAQDRILDLEHMRLPIDQPVAHDGQPDAGPQGPVAHHRMGPGRPRRLRHRRRQQPALQVRPHAGPGREVHAARDDAAAPMFREGDPMNCPTPPSP